VSLASLSKLLKVEILQNNDLFFNSKDLFIQKLNRVAEQTGSYGEIDVEILNTLRNPNDQNK
jgi:hypothetical protein